VTPAGNLPPVSTRPVVLVGKFTAGVVNTGGKFAISVVDTSGKFAAGIISLKLVANLPMVSLILVVHLDFQILKKIWNDPNVIYRDTGEDDSRKKPEAKNLVTHSLKLDKKECVVLKKLHINMRFWKLFLLAIICQNNINTLIRVSLSDELCRFVTLPYSISAPK
jgi:hypothetical protein